MNQCCFGLDVLIEEVKAFSSKSDIGELVEKSIHTLNFKSNVQKLQRINFFIEFSVLSFIFCLTLYSISADPFGSVIVYAVFQVTLSQFFVSCWMGSRIDERIEKLNAAIYDTDWYSMNPKQRVEVSMILTWALRLKGFDGIFNQVNMETFQKVK